MSMKKILFSILVLSAALSCQQEVDQDPVKDPGVVYASIDDVSGTKTALNEFNNVVWAHNDAITVFDKSSFGDVYVIKDEFVGKNYGEFSLYSENDGGDPLDHYVAFYPESGDLNCVYNDFDGYVLTGIDIPDYQYYIPDTFANGSFPMVAVSEDVNLKFRNLLGGIKLQLTGTQRIEYISISGSCAEVISGSADAEVSIDGSDPQILMHEDGSNYMTLYMEESVQLKEDEPTEFIISLPPVTFKAGFRIEISDDEGNIYNFGTVRESIIHRSKLLVMPPIKVEQVDLNYVVAEAYIRIYEMETASVPVEVEGYTGADTPTLTWSSSDPSVATVDQNGIITAVSEGEAYIFFAVSPNPPHWRSIFVEVLPSAECTADYVDEYGINHGKGTAMGDVVWAPVNCGYHQTDFKYGKLYQWGRKYGQGYSGTMGDVDVDSEGNLVGADGTYSDAVLPDVLNGPVSLDVGQSDENANTFIVADIDPFDWLSESDDRLWNSGTEENPKKTEYDPCPKGWRVPAYSDYEKSYQRMYYYSDEKEQDGVKGVLISLETSYTSYTPQLFIPYSGSCFSFEGNTYYYGRGVSGLCFTSTIDDEYDSPVVTMVYSVMSLDSRAFAHPVRCVQE